MPKKLSTAQQRVVNLMEQGYQLGRHRRMVGGSAYRLQEGGIGKGGKSEKTTKTVVLAMLNAGVIEVDQQGWNTSTYLLVNKDPQ